MKPEDFSKLVSLLKEEVAARPRGARVALSGRTSVAFDLEAVVNSLGQEVTYLGIFANDIRDKPISALAAAKPDIVVIASDDGKELLLEAVAAVVEPTVRLLIAGSGHFAFRDELFDQVKRDLFIPSFANGYPHSLVHIYQCLKFAASRKLQGVVAEFGMFKGGTTMLMSRFIEGLGAHWKVYGFDTFSGFPDPRSALDLYHHPDCVYLDEAMIKRVFEGRNVEVVVGNVVETVDRLRTEDIVLAFVDTDNFTSANAIVSVIADRVVEGGAIVFDHWTGRDRHLFTIGERIAAKRLAEDKRYFNLHDTGVFLRMP
ncbi:TylF/MycF/NovP-related O-methyltransferase [Mesorhizobium yinganensis]|uniref:TylF/MycF/NovP-related O-methyltransferase n=1 Tax=Mesorhizobium yinganensis TaxID=3157707 RepID=UPI0032B70CD7